MRDPRGMKRSEARFHKQFELRQRRKQQAEKLKDKYGIATENQEDNRGIRTDWRTDRA
jgi:hypothetical protein